MDKPVSAADANRRFSELLRGVKKGRSYLVTSHGEPVARIVPVEEESSSTARSKAALLKRLRSQHAVKIDRWSREELYQDK